MKLLESVFWKILPYIPLIFLFSIVVFFIQHYNAKIPRENIKEAIGTVTGYQVGGTSMRPAELAFSVKGKKYIIYISSNYDVGEKFVVEYEKNEPKINKARIDKPVFLTNEKTSITVGIVENYNPNYFREISFIYFVNGNKYKQSYEPIKNSKLKYPNLREGNKYKVKYWNENPKRSIILLDEPTTESLNY
jgi:hypothetical protein